MIGKNILMKYVKTPLLIRHDYHTKLCKNFVSNQKLKKKPLVFQHAVLSRVKRSIRELCPFLSDKCFASEIGVELSLFFLFMTQSQSVKTVNLMGVYVLLPMVSNNRETSCG